MGVLTLAKGSSKVEAWQLVLSIIYIFLGIIIGVRLHAEFSGGAKTSSLAIEVLLLFTATIAIWAFTYSYSKRKAMKNEKDLARNSIRKTFELLKTANRTLDNIDIKAATILNSNTNKDLDRALAHEFVQNIRTQVVEIYNDISVCIEEWRDVLEDEFDEIERRERQIDKLVIDQIIKTRKLHELERKNDANENDIDILRGDLDRLAEKQRVSRTSILSESRKLVGAPITTIMDITSASYSIGKFEPIIKQPVYVSKSTEVEIKSTQ
ncbi:MAG TPA: hypothetical protein DE036_08180 [Actinobacteria bacterium]|nr:hypothetical protein [Actinomycetota bacterium]